MWFLSFRHGTALAPRATWGACATITGMLLLSALVLAPAPLAAADSHTPLTVSIESITPAVAGPGATITIRGTVRAPVAVAATLAVRVGRTALTSRGELARGGGIPKLIGPPDERVVLPAGKEPRPFTIDMPADSLSLSGFGVYPLSVKASAAGVDPVTIRTFLPWVPRNASIAPTRVVWLWPLIDRPNRGPEGLFLDDSLARSIDGGRLSRLLELPQAAQVPVTYAVDPQLLEDLRAMQSGYRLRTPGLSVPTPAATASATLGGTPPPQSAAADRWLKRYETATATAPTYLLPYGDPDISGVLKAEQRSSLEAAIDRSTAIAGRPDPRHLAWPVDGALRRESAATAVAVGMNTLVLDPGPGAEAQNYTPDARSTVDTPNGSATVLLPDPTLSALVTRPVNPTSEETPALVRQRFLAETAMITAERPSDGRTVLIAPPHRWEPQGTATADILAAGANVPWLQWGTVEGAAPEGAAQTTFPVTAKPGHLPVPYLNEVAEFEAEARAVSTMVSDEGAVLDGYLAYALRLRSSALRDQAAQARSDLGATDLSRAELLALGHDLLEQYESGVRIVSSAVTLGARDGPIPVTVANNLPVPVRVQVKLTPRLPRLLVHETREVSVAAGRKAQINVPASGVANGDVIVDAQLLTPDGREFGSAVPIRVGITNVGAWGTYLTIGGAVTFVLAALLRIAMRVRRHRAGMTTQPDSEP